VIRNLIFGENLMTTLVIDKKSSVTTPPALGIETHVGNTPLLPLRTISSRMPVYAKAEWFNPGGSVKDRPALNIIRAALAAGDLPAGRRLLDSTSGNMGIAYATLAGAFDIQVTLVIPANASPERLTILNALGVELVLSDPLEGTDGAIQVARSMAAENPAKYFYADQYNNPANWQAHYLTTGPEIVEQAGSGVSHFVAGLGTSGTLMGIGRYLRQYNPAVQIIGVQPDAAFHGLEGLKHMPTAIQPGIYDQSFPDRILEVPTEAAYEMTLRLARQEGLFVGVSSGAAAVAAQEIAAELNQGLVVTIFPDSGYKYLSESFWEAVQ
jgi:cysteine synthase B